MFARSNYKKTLNYSHDPGKKLNKPGIQGQPFQSPGMTTAIILEKKKAKQKYLFEPYFWYVRTKTRVKIM